MTIAEPLDYILDRISICVESGCWVYPCRSYGAIVTTSGSRRVHRLVYEELVGPIPDGFHIDHLCRVTQCCNPDHLEPVTPEENARRVYARPWWPHIVPMLNLAEMAGEIGRSTSTVAELIESGDLKAFRISNTYWALRENFEEFLMRHPGVLGRGCRRWHLSRFPQPPTPGDEP